MRLQKLLNNLIGIIVEYSTSELKSPLNQDYSKQDLVDLIGELNKIKPNRAPLLNYFLNIVDSIQVHLDTKQRLSKAVKDQISSQLTPLITNCQVLLGVQSKTQVTLPDNQSLYGLQTWSMYYGAIPCHSGTMIVDKLFNPLKLTKDSSLEHIQSRINKLIKKYQTSIRDRGLEAEIEQLKQNLLESKNINTRLLAENQALHNENQALRNMSQSPKELVSIPLSPLFLGLSGSNTQTQSDDEEFSLPNTTSCQLTTTTTSTQSNEKSAHVTYSIFPSCDWVTIYAPLPQQEQRFEM